MASISGNFTYFRSLIIFVPRKNVRKVIRGFIILNAHKAYKKVNEWSRVSKSHINTHFLLKLEG
jgi:hypothetical protein